MVASRSLTSLLRSQDIIESTPRDCWLAQLHQYQRPPGDLIVAIHKEKISNYYLAHALQRAWESTKLIKDEEWQTQFSKLTPQELAAELRRIAKHVDLRQYLESTKRGPKKPQSERTQYRGKPHVSTQRLLDRSKRE